LDDAIAAKLLLSIEANRLVALCGAGLSMSTPSLVPSAYRVAMDCAQKYANITGQTLPLHCIGNIEQTAEFFLQQGQFQTFIKDLIEWRTFRGTPNPGHSAIADLLACHGLQLAVTTNLDVLIENAARELGEPDFLPAIDGHDAQILHDHAPLLKIHGCCVIDRFNTLWSRSQLHSDPLKTRIESSGIWLRGALNNRDILFLGFWSDWSYLNQVLATCTNGSTPSTVFLVDPADDAALATKAPDLWNWANANPTNFHHIRSSGDSFLDELRKLYSIQFMKRLLQMCSAAYTGMMQTSPSIPQDFGNALGSEQLFELRRDTCGNPPGEIPRQKRPDSAMTLVGCSHLFLIERGATLEGPGYLLNGKRIRVIQTAGKPLSLAKQQFQALSSVAKPDDVVICAGARDDGRAPSNIVRQNSQPTIVRPTKQPRLGYR
jgi:hypothetical protein